MVPFWVPIIIRHLILRVPQKGIIILTTTHVGIETLRFPRCMLSCGQAVFDSSLHWHADQQKDVAHTHDRGCLTYIEPRAG